MYRTAAASRPVVGIVGYYLGPEESSERGFGERRINAFALTYIERAGREGLLSICLPVASRRPSAVTSTWLTA
jgi:hypothetical protein